MKLYLTELKQLLGNIQKHQIQQIKIIDSNFELLINTLQIQEVSITKKKNVLTHNSYTLDVKKPEHITNSKKTEKHLTIVSPMIGTFYRASSPSELPFVNISDEIKSSQTVCIIEAMKLMNEIEAEVNGTIIDILVKDGEFVDCGQALMIVKPL